MELVVGSRGIYGKGMGNVMCGIRGWMAGLPYNISVRYRVGGLGQRLGGGVSGGLVGV